MSWLTEVRAATKGLNVDTVEMSEATIVKFRHVYLWLQSDRSYYIENEEPLTPAEVGHFEVIMSRLDRRVWRLA